MKAQRMLNQQAQEHAAACALFARLLGQLMPSFIRLPVLDTNLDEPPQRLGLDHIEWAPGEISSQQRPIAIFVCVFQRHDDAWGGGTDVQPRPAHDHQALFAPTDADGLWRPAMGRKSVSDMLRTFVEAHLLIAAQLREDLRATDNRRGALHTGGCTREGVGHKTVDVERRMGGLARREPAQREVLFG
jgi:hypothetical protein